MPEYFIVMGDIVGSRRHDAGQLRREFEKLLSSCNRDLENMILSAYTTTLGDEFQGVAKSLHGATECIFYLENAQYRKGYNFKLRYVVHFGEIQTPITKEIAYGMMGPGLTRARRLLMDKRRGQPRFLFDLPERRLAENLIRLCEVIDGLSNRWDRQDYSLIFDMLESPKNEEVAEKYDKNRSQIWKRRKNLLIEEYRLTRAVVLDLTAEKGEKREQ